MTSLKLSLPDEAATLAFASKLASVVTDGMILFLHGDLGAGKTTFTRGFLRGLGYTEKVKSPTYTLVEPYEIKDKKIFHFDLYRLDDPQELHFIGIQDYFFPQSICLIEWPEKGSPFLPQPDLACYIEFRDQGREMRLLAHTQKGDAVLKALQAL